MHVIRDRVRGVRIRKPFEKITQYFLNLIFKKFEPGDTQSSTKKKKEKTIPRHTL